MEASSNRRRDLFKRRVPGSQATSFKKQEIAKLAATLVHDHDMIFHQFGIDRIPLAQLFVGPEWSPS